MKVFITGATGFIGAHMALELLRAGHQVRLLVRDHEAADNYFSSHGFELDDIVVGDMLDAPLVKQSMQGCDAVVHAAAIVDLNARNAEKTLSVNLAGLKSVVGSACETGIEKILYVSSLSAIFNINRELIDESSPLATSTEPYSRSKTLCEEQIRQWQAEGYPIISTYPSGVFGPYDPKMSESNKAFIEFYNSLVPVTSSGIQFVDVRDLAKMQRLLLEKPVDEDVTNERYVIAGHFLPWNELANLAEKSAGTKIRRLYIAPWCLSVIGYLMDLLRYIFPVSFPLSREAVMIVTKSPPASSAKIVNKLGITFTDPARTFTDTYQWYLSRGQIKKQE